MTPLEQFERIALNQPQPRQWRPVTDYSEPVRREAEGPHVDRIISALHPEDVLDVGCGPGHLVRWLRERGVRAWGCDLYPPDEEFFFYADVTYSQSVRPPWTERYDLVICREVLEHLRILDIARAIQRLVTWSRRLIYVTTRFVSPRAHLLSVQTHDELDPTHISILHQDLVRMLFVLQGCRRRVDLEQELDWKNVGRVLIYEKVPH